MARFSGDGRTVKQPFIGNFGILDWDKAFSAGMLRWRPWRASIEESRISPQDPIFDRLDGVRLSFEGMMRLHSLFLAWLAFVAIPVGAQTSDTLRIARVDFGVSITQVDGASGHVYHLETSHDLHQWQEVAMSTALLEDYALSVEGSAFLRTRGRPRDEAADWTNQLSVFDERIFTDRSANQLAFAKFTLKLAEPDRVYFQDSDRYPFHYDFARVRLAGYEGISYTDYLRRSLFLNGQELVIGTVILAPDPNITEVAIQFTGNESFPKEAIATWFRAVRSRVVAPDGWRFIYLPSFEQSDLARENETWFRDQGIVVDSAARWITENVCYSPGWALGRIKVIASSDIDAAYGEGRLSHADILVTDQIPAEIPVVAGVIALAPATPNSHVAILSKSFGIPFAFLSGNAWQEQIRAMDGRETLLVVSAVGDDCEIRLQDVEGKLAPTEREAILASKRPLPLNFAPIASAGTYAFDVAELTPNELSQCGGKAVNFGLLRRTIPASSPDPAIALTFDLWMDFMAQPFGNGTLGESIAADLDGYAFPPDMMTLRPRLEAIRDRIRQEGDFTGDQKGRVLDALADFQGHRKLRFRSSTNLEDTENFSGAGLYDSFSGCLADDADADAAGPSHCDASESSERGIFRAIRKVYASFYNENAFIERLRHGVDEAQVGMAILVHYSFPDEVEEANGVATLAIRKPADVARMVTALLVSQVGASSVTNPDHAFLPEVVSSAYSGAIQEASLTVDQRSSLAGEGGNVMQWPEDYSQLLGLLDDVARAYEVLYPEAQVLDLDFEWKKVAPGELIVKQVRQIPLFRSVPPPIIN